MIRKIYNQVPDLTQDMYSNHLWLMKFSTLILDLMKKVNKQCLLDTPRTVRVSEKTWQVIVQTSRP